MYYKRWFRKKSKSSLFRHSSESRARSEAFWLSSKFNAFWMPDQVRHDDLGTFYEAIIKKINRNCKLIDINSREILN